MKVKVNILKCEQPIGSFYLATLKMTDLEQICKVIKRLDDDNLIDRQELMIRTDELGIQRSTNTGRIKQIADYSGDPDATFPTPIILAVSETSEYEIHEGVLEYDTKEFQAQIIDGQHRFLGLKDSKYKDKFELPVIFMFNLSIIERAYVFSTINGNQDKVSKSLVYDLFGAVHERSPYKTCHDIARLLNYDMSSPFYRRLKMLGIKNYEKASLSQGTFVEYLIKLISINPKKDTIDLKNGSILDPDDKLPLRKFFINNQDEMIYSIIRNMFNAIKNTFSLEWFEPQEYILSKTTGYVAFIKELNRIYEFAVKNGNNLTEGFFENICLEIKQLLNQKSVQLVSKDFPSSEQGISRLRQIISEALNSQNDIWESTGIDLNDIEFETKKIDNSFMARFAEVPIRYRTNIYKLLKVLTRKRIMSKEERFNNTFVSYNKNVVLYYESGNAAYRNFYLTLSSVYGSINIATYLENKKILHFTSEEDPNSPVWISRLERFIATRYLKQNTKTIYDEILEVLDIPLSYDAVQLSYKQLESVVNFYTTKTIK